MRHASLLLILAAAAAGCADEGTPLPGEAPPEGDGMTLEQAFQGTGTGMGQIGPAAVQQSRAAYAFLTGVATQAEMAPLIAAGVGGTILNYGVMVEATGAVELFSLFVPDSDPGQSRPLVTAFHGAGSSHGDIYFRAQEIFVEAAQRDWFLIAPLQRSLSGPADLSYASAQSQLHVEVLIRLILDTYAIDRDRLYGIGFSMGGGNAMSYAARHRDRRSGAFAAVVNHTGTLDLVDVYSNAPSGVQTVLEGIYNGPPTGELFEWQRSSLIELNAGGALKFGGAHMAVNLASVPIQTWYNAQDQFGYLLNQQDRLDGLMQSLSGAAHQLVTVTGGVPNCVDQHCWGTLDIPAACDWLAQRSLASPPLQGEVLADRDGRWGVFDVEQAQPSAFTSFDFVASGIRLSIATPVNLAQLTVGPGRFGISQQAPYELRLQGVEASGAAFTLRGAQSRPSAVLRNGVAFSENCATSTGWCYEASAQTVTIRETAALPSVWRIVP